MRPISFSFLLPFLPLTAAYTPLSPALLKSLPAPSPSDFDLSSPSSLLAPLLIPRVPGTPGQTAAQAHLAAFFRTHLPQWELLWQNSTSTTPATGDRQIPFANLIVRRLPPGLKKEDLGGIGMLTLVAHYDSKIQPKGFVGATDSAAPCAVLMDVARAVEGVLGRVWKGGEAQGVQVLLLDGEEAFVSWTETDSLYGARALAAEWEVTPYPAMSTFANPLRQISLFVLLDLLGAPHPEVPSYFQSTHWAYKKMAALEGRLRQEGLLESAPGDKPFLPEPSKPSADFSGAGFVGDDHVPFMARGAPVLHLIPSPFPPVWHTMADDGAHLDLPTVRDWSRIVTAFTLEYLDVETAPEAKGG